MTRQDPSAPRLILGVDRLDYTKGILQRLLAVERCWSAGQSIAVAWSYPDRGANQRAGSGVRPAQEARSTKRWANQRPLLGRLGGRRSGTSPGRSIASLAGLYARTDVALVTPLRDGMNLVAKEYVAAQVADPGVLMLSELAGAAEELQEAVARQPIRRRRNGRRPRGCAGDAGRGAPGADGRTSRPGANQRRGGLAQAVPAGGRTRNRCRGHDQAPPVEILIRRLGPWLGSGERAALFLDFDGTLTPIVSDPDSAISTPRRSESSLALAEAPHLDVAVVSGRMLSDLRARVPNAGLTLVGNHGLELEGPGIHWRHPEVEQWTDTLRRRRRNWSGWRSRAPGSNSRARHFPGTSAPWPRPRRRGRPQRNAILSTRSAFAS